LTDELSTLDLSSESFDQFVEFFFNREVMPDEKQCDYFLTELAGEQYEEAVHSLPSLVVTHMTELFSEFGVIAPKYSLAQLDQGIWGIFGENLRLYELLWDSSVPLEKRLQCVRSMFAVFSNFVSISKVEVMQNCSTCAGI
jgi:hypothetical protein